MRILLDTHTVYWYTTGDFKLSTPAQNAIQDIANDVLIIPVSLWEIAIKVSKGKWQMNQPFDIFWQTCYKKYGFRLLPLEPSHTITVCNLPYPTNHRDTFDRMLASQALCENIQIVSADESFDAYGISRIW